MSLADEIRTQGDTAARPGQMEELHDLAWRVEELETTSRQWQRQYEHAQERYEAQFRLNAELIQGLKKVQADAWDEGYEAAVAVAYGGPHVATTNPYRKDDK
jgi:hypothetical protein